MEEQNLALVHFLKQQIMQQQQRQQQDDLNAAKLLLNLTSKNLISPASSPSSQTTKIIKSHPKFRAKVSRKKPITFYLKLILNKKKIIIKGRVFRK